MNQTELKIKEALARNALIIGQSDVVPPRAYSNPQTLVRKRPPASWPKVAAVITCVLVLGVAVFFLNSIKGPKISATDASAQLSVDQLSNRWNLVSMQRAGENVSIPRQFHAWVEFGRDGSIGVSDGCNFSSGSFEITGDQLSANSAGGTTGAGCPGTEPFATVIESMRIVTSGADLTTTIQGNVLTIDLRSTTMTFAVGP